jgi:hypothetical protein
MSATSASNRDSIYRAAHTFAINRNVQVVRLVVDSQLLGRVHLDRSHGGSRCRCRRCQGDLLAPREVFNVLSISDPLCGVLRVGGRWRRGRRKVVSGIIFSISHHRHRVNKATSTMAIGDRGISVPYESDAQTTTYHLNAGQHVHWPPLTSSRIAVPAVRDMWTVSGLLIRGVRVHGLPALRHCSHRLEKGTFRVAWWGNGGFLRWSWALALDWPVPISNDPSLAPCLGASPASAISILDQPPTQPYQIFVC